MPETDCTDLAVSTDHADPGPPICLALSDADRAKIDAAVHWLNQTVEDASLDLASAVKRYVLDEFFDGDYARFADPSPDKPMSFRELCRRPDLAIGGTALYRMIRIAAQAEQMPAALAQRLSMRHHRALLPVEDEPTRNTLAQQALEQKWTSDQLSAAIRDLQPPSRAGRPPLPPVVKEARKVQRVLTGLDEGGPPEQWVAGLPGRYLQELDAQLASGTERLALLRAAVQAELARLDRAETE